MLRKINFNIKILVIGDENSDKTMILDYGADEFALKPMSPEKHGRQDFDAIGSR